MVFQSGRHTACCTHTEHDLTMIRCTKPALLKKGKHYFEMIRLTLKFCLKFSLISNLYANGTVSHVVNAVWSLLVFQMCLFFVVVVYIVYVLNGLGRECNCIFDFHFLLLNVE